MPVGASLSRFLTYPIPLAGPGEDGHRVTRVPGAEVTTEKTPQHQVAPTATPLRRVPSPTPLSGPAF